MKNIVTAFFLLLSALVIFLATVDLEHYLKGGTTESDPQYLAETDSTPEPALVSSTADVPVQPPAQVVLADQVKTSDPVPLEEEEQPQNVHQIDFAKQQAQANIENRVISTAQDVVDTKATTNQHAEEKTEALAPTGSQPPRTSEAISSELSSEKNKLDKEKISTPLIELEVSVGDEGDYPYSILLATFLRENNAQKAITIYKKQNISAHWVKVGLDDDENVRYRLFTGAFSTKNQALQYLEQQHLTDGIVKTTRYSSRIGIYQDETELAKDFVKAQESGFLPYVLANRSEVYSLYVGAYYTYEGASNQCEKLLEVGMNCRPVTRSTGR